MVGLRSRRRDPGGNPWGGLVPALVLICVFFLLPTLNLVRLSLTTPDGYGVDNFEAFFATAHLVDALTRSIFLATTATLLSSLLAWPLAFYISFVLPPRWRVFGLLVLIAPFWTSFTIRAFSWQLVLSDNGIIAWFLSLLVGAPVQLGFLYTMGASVLGLTLFGVMLTTLTLFSAMTAIDHRLIEASASLGARPGTVFRDIILPLAAPGWAVGATLTFIICVGDYAVPTLLGGGLKPVLAQIMLTTVKGTYDLPAAAAMAMVLAGVVLLAVLPVLLVRLRRTETA